MKGLIDIFSPERIAEIKRDKSRTNKAAFMRGFRDRVIKQEQRPPDHWIEFAAELLGAAADSAEEPDKKERSRLVTRALGLSGRDNNSSRNWQISMTFLYLSSMGMTIHAAANEISVLLADDFNTKVSESTLISIFSKARNEGFSPANNEYPKVNEVQDFDPEDFLKPAIARIASYFPRG